MGPLESTRTGDTLEIVPPGLTRFDGCSGTGMGRIHKRPDDDSESRGPCTLSRGARTGLPLARRTRFGSGNPGAGDRRCDAGRGAPEVAPQAAAPVGTYDIADDALRRATYLTRAVLVRPLATDDALAKAFDETGLRFARLEADERFGQYACGAIDEGSARPWLDLAARELALHAPALVRASGTRWIVSCQGLSQGGRARGAVPAGSAGTILLDAEADASEDFFRRTLHHELFHMLDFAEGRLKADAEWVGLNASGTQYGGGLTAREASNALGSGSAGFVTEYAMSGADEDKAEMFRFLALAPGELRALAERDAVVASKRDLMLRRLAGYCAAEHSRIVCGER